MIPRKRRQPQCPLLVLFLFCTVPHVHAFSILEQEVRVPVVLLSSHRPLDDDNHQRQQQGLRINKVFRSTHSRRQADKLIADGRVSVNGHLVCEAGMRVARGDVIQLDGCLYTGWEDQLQLLLEEQASDMSKESFSSLNHEYIKYWKPLGVVCTTDERIPGNVLQALLQAMTRNSSRLQKRVFPVGRLDKETDGLILLTL